MKHDIAAIRKDYIMRSLDEHEVAPLPMDQFNSWFNDALHSNLEEVNAMTLATVDASGRPSARIVLLKGVNDNGFVFFTNYESRKGKEMAENSFVSLVFFWKELERQVRIEGIVEKISEKESDEYFHSRPVGSRLGAWASPQSKVIESREYIEKRSLEFSEKWKDAEIERPPFWGGYIVKPDSVEFWQGRASRLHDRIRYSLTEDKWVIERLAP